MLQDSGALAAFGAAILWGFNAFFIRKGLKTSNPFTGALLSLAVSSFIYFILTIFTGSFYEALPTFNLIFLASAGFVGYSLAYLFYFNSIELIGAPRAATITSSRPLLAALLALLIFREEITLNLGMGTLLVVIGVIFVSGDSGVRKKSRRGEILAILTAFCWSIYPILVKEGLRGVMSIFKPTFITMLVGISLFVILISFFKKFRLLLQLDKSSLSFFTFSGFANGFANLLFFMALSSSPVTLVMPLSNIYPFIAILLGILLLDEKISVKIFLGAILIFLGVVLVVT
jgi:transporter family protein